MTDGELLRPATVPVMRARRARRLLQAGGLSAAIAGAVATGAHAEYPFLLRWLGLCPPDVRLYRCEDVMTVNVAFGVVCALLIVGYAVVLHRFVPVRRVIRCRGCRGRGWVLDLEPDGVCPRCGGDRFDAWVWRSGLASAGTMPWVTRVTWTDVDGRTLVARRRAGEQGVE